MYILIGSTTYTKLRNLHFAPQTDVRGDAVPINTFSVDILTSDTLTYGQYASLYDDAGSLWAKYWLSYAEQADEATVHLEAQSILALLDRVTLPAVMYNGDNAATVITGLFPAASDVSVAAAFSSATLSGYCPQQTARERLQAVCFALGAYVKSYFSGVVEILSVSQAETLIPLRRTYWKPVRKYKDYVTAVRVTGYSYQEATPQTTDTWVEAGGRYYVVTPQTYTLSNPDVPSGAPTNVVAVEGVGLVNASNADAILAQLATYWFKRQELDADVIDNGEYLPGQRVMVYVNEAEMITGYIETADFRFGVQARAALHITPVEARETGTLDITYTWDDIQIGSAHMVLPVGYVYSIDNPYIDLVLSSHRYVFRPLAAAATGTMTVAGVTDTESYDVALDHFTRGDGRQLLSVLAVDGAVMSTRETGVLVIT